MKVYLKNGSVLTCRPSYIDLTKSLILFYIIDDKTGKEKKVFISQEEIKMIEYFEDIEE